LKNSAHCAASIANANKGVEKQERETQKFQKKTTVVDLPNPGD
jgi:hypothetical protein